MNKKRLITTSVISIFLVAVLLIGSTYSIFFSQQIDPNSNVYTTGNLDVTYTLDEGNIKFDSIVPMAEDEVDDIMPYRITVTNNGTVPYMFNIILNSTTANVENEINEQYIMTKIGNLESKALADCLDNIIKDSIVLKAGESVDIDIRIWISDMVQNTEIGKSFYGKIVIDGLAVPEDTDDTDNSALSLNHMKTLFDTPDDTSYYKSIDYRDKIVMASFVDYIDTSNAVIDEDSKIVSWDLSDAQNGSIVAWLEADDTSDNYKLYIGSTAKIYGDNLSNLFSNMKSLKNIDFGNLSTILTKKMSNMFYECSNLTTTIVIMNAEMSDYEDVFNGAATIDGTLITVGYTNNTKDLVEQMIATVSSGSNVKLSD